jgi:hypothetical protein
VCRPVRVGIGSMSIDRHHRLRMYPADGTSSEPDSGGTVALTGIRQLRGATIVHVQASALPSGDHPGLCSLVLQVRDLVLGLDRDDAGARGGSGPVHDHALGSSLRARAQEARAGVSGLWPPSWRVHETYVKVGGRWKYLFRAVDKHGQWIDFMLSEHRNTRAAHRSSVKP